MTPEAFDAFCRSLPAATVDIKWGADRCYSVGGKMFAVAGLGSGHYAFKCSDGSFEQLVEEGVARPAPYAARFKWVQLTAPDVVPDEQLRRYLETAHRLVAEKLPRKARAELGLA